MGEEGKPGGELIIFQTEDAQTRLQVRMDGQTAWLTQLQMAELFQTTVPNVNLHLRNIYEEGELHEGATIKEYLIVRLEGRENFTRRDSDKNGAGIFKISRAGRCQAKSCGKRF
ncbi:MAG TPA: hypothetical protein VH619_15840 [Verrucomicrobiae bacterium]|jgi:hypothetical protein|nr:hypothetical protein [Verrucomicrobiae bacterium]